MAAADPCCDVADTLVADLPGPAFAVQRARLALVQERQAFARANLRLVVTLANRYRRSGRLALVDLIQEGNVGLLAAIDRFDPARGFRFSTYAAFWIRHALGRALSDRGRIVRLPSHVVELQTKLRSIEAAFEVEHGRRPDADELAQRAGVTVRQVEKLSRVLVERAQPEDDAAELDSLACSDPRAESKIDAVQLERALARALEDLAPIEIEILSLRFGLEGGEGLTLREVGTNYSLSRERVRQIQARALRKLRDDLARRGHDQPAI
jgi:RNA polymerase primary sigma factor